MATAMLAHMTTSHQRGRGLSSSRMPSHSWPVVSTPLTSSISRSDMVALVIFQGEGGEAFEGLLVLRPERVDHGRGEDQREVNQPALLGEARHLLVFEIE